MVLAIFRTASQKLNSPRSTLKECRNLKDYPENHPKSTEPRHTQWLDCDVFASAPDAPDDGIGGYFDSIQHLDHITSAKHWAALGVNKCSTVVWANQ